jgi:hypothetical protein
MTFWPKAITSDEVKSPKAILLDAARELEGNAEVLQVNVKEVPLEDRVVLQFIVVNRAADATLNLFESSHRLNEPYPVAICPPTFDVPEFLKRKRYVAGVSSPFLGALEMANIHTKLLESSPGRYVDNPWVCATPLEFKEKLVGLFALDGITTRVISLMAMDPKTTDALHSDEGTEGSGEPIEPGSETSDPSS